MADKQMDDTIKRYVVFLVKKRVEVTDKFQEAKKSRIESKERLEFKQNLQEFYELYFSKFNNRDDVERPGWAEKEILNDVKVPEDVTEMNWQRSKALYYIVCQLQEKLGHTTIESDEWKEEGIGGKDIAEENKKKLENEKGG